MSGEVGSRISEPGMAKEPSGGQPSQDGDRNFHPDFASPWLSQRGIARELGGNCTTVRHYLAAVADSKYAANPPPGSGSPSKCTTNPPPVWWAVGQWPGEFLPAQRRTGARFASRRLATDEGDDG